MERAQKAKGVAEAAIRLGEMEKQAALAAKREAEQLMVKERQAAQDNLRKEEQAFEDRMKDLESRHKQEVRSACMSVLSYHIFLSYQP